MPSEDRRRSEDSPERRARLRRLAFQRLGSVGASSAEQVQAIVDRALADPPPVSHPHSFEETGMCDECDAAWVLAVEAMEEEMRRDR
jgi:hypothetical protein